MKSRFRWGRAPRPVLMAAATGALVTAAGWAASAPLERVAGYFFVIARPAATRGVDGARQR